MNCVEALKVASVIFPRSLGALRCIDSIDPPPCQIELKGQLVAAGDDWSETLRVAREHRYRGRQAGRHLEQQSLL